MKKNINSLSFWLHLTDNCNLTCDYCYISTLKTNRNMDKLVIVEFTNKLIITLKKHRNIKIVNLKLAGGEPLTQFEKWKSGIQFLINKLQENDIKIKIRVITNLTILNKDIIEFSQKNQISFAVSLDGLDKYHNKYRKFINQKGSFDIIQKNLLKLKKYKIPFAVLVTISNENLEGIVELTKYLLDNNITFRLADAKGVNINREKLLNVLNQVYKMMEDYPSFNIKYKHLLCDLNLIEPMKTSCNMGINAAAIYLNGDIYFCHSQFGSVNKMGSIYETDDLLEIIQKGYIFHSLSDECQKCEFKYICAGGCPLYRDHNNKTPMCDVFKKIIPKIQNLILKY